MGVVADFGSFTAIFMPILTPLKSKLLMGAWCRITLLHDFMGLWVMILW